MIGLQNQGLCLEPGKPQGQAVASCCQGGSPRAMSRFLRHFTVVGDDHYKWNTRYKRWDNEDDEDEQPQIPTAPAPAPAPTPAAVTPGTESSPPEAPGEVVTPPKVPQDFRTVMRKLFRSHRFQVGATESWTRDEAGFESLGLLATGQPSIWSKPQWLEWR
ncbi:voltage-gated hydrogen channel 1 [Petaurus breviceps papuanus]|uniref:voltage-gated hydrogen channel 1 n=1 Tax=Petaurus breviceps papuanus TaxID=3040969 RepID=UPI0036D80810